MKSFCVAFFPASSRIQERAVLALVAPWRRLDEYGGGDEAEYNSWVILEKAAAVREEAGSS